MEVAIFTSVSDLTFLVGCFHVLCQISLDLCLVTTLSAIENIGAVRNSSVINHVAVTAELDIAKLANVYYNHMLCPKMMPYVDAGIGFKRTLRAGKLCSQVLCLLVKLQQGFSLSLVLALVTGVFYLPVDSFLVFFHACLCCCHIRALITRPSFLLMNRLYVPRQVPFLSTFIVASMTMVKYSTVSRFLVVDQVPFYVCVVFAFFTFIISLFSFHIFLFVMDIFLVNFHPIFSECSERTHVTWPTNQFMLLFNVSYKVSFSCSLVITLLTGILNSFVFFICVELQSPGCLTLIITLTASIFSNTKFIIANAFLFNAGHGNYHFRSEKMREAKLVQWCHTPLERCWCKDQQVGMGAKSLYPDNIKSSWPC